mgnify:CR=1 FL=1
MATGLTRLRDFVRDATRIVETEADEARILEALRPKLGALVAEDDWLPDAFAAPHPDHYQQYLLYCDPFERFSLVSFVWGPGQRTPIHDHTVWGLIGVLRGAETCRNYDRRPDGTLVPGPEKRLTPGEVEAVSPRIGDIHEVANAFADRTSISIHIYGANIGAVKRHVFKVSGETKDFVSGYGNVALPNIWDRSAEVRAALGVP